MELIEVLVLISLAVDFLLFFIIVYLFAKMTLLSKMKSPEQIAEEILRTKVPVLMGPDGVPIMPGMPQHGMGQPIPDGRNPITG